MWFINKYPLGTLILFSLFSVGVSILINILLLRFSKTLGMRELQQKNAIRWSASHKPSLGGITFFILMLLSISIYSIIENTTLNKSISLGLFFSSSLGFLIGLADDAYNTNPLLKFIGQFICANIMIIFGIYIHIHSNFIINYLFTTIWVVGIMNSINMLDNMDGITASVASSIIALLIIMSFSLNNNIINMFNFMMAGTLAALLGFLFFNWPPSKIFMGDSGSQLLGVFLSGMSILYLWNYIPNPSSELQIKQFILPLVVFIIPIIDTTTVFIRRIISGSSPFIGGKDHTTHMLVYFGVKEYWVPLLLAGITFLSLPVIYIFITNHNVWNTSYSLGIIVYFLILFSVVQYIYYSVGKNGRSLS